MGALSTWKKKKKMMTAKPTKYKVEVIEVLLGVEIEGDMLRNVNNLKYFNHDVRDLTKLPQFAKEK